MQKGRLESFSDGVLAIVITIMVLQLKVPHGATFAALRPGLPVFLGYVLSFVYVGIYWTNHYSLLASARKIDGRVLWPNLHLLFWLSLVPYATDWMGETSFAAAPLAAYGFVLLATSLAFKRLQVRLLLVSSSEAVLAHTLNRD